MFLYKSNHILQYGNTLKRNTQYGIDPYCYILVYIGVAIGGARGAIAPPLFKSKGLSPSTFYK